MQKKSLVRLTDQERRPASGFSDSWKAYCGADQTGRPMPKRRVLEGQEPARRRRRRDTAEFKSEAVPMLRDGQRARESPRGAAAAQTHPRGHHRRLRRRTELRPAAGEKNHHLRRPRGTRHQRRRSGAVVVEDLVDCLGCHACSFGASMFRCLKESTVFPVFACGNCVYYALWQKFPPVASWAVIIPLWFVALAAIRTYSELRIAAVPEVYFAIPLVLAVWLFAPGTLGPILGMWIPVCCLIGTNAALRPSQSPTLRRAVIRLSIVTGVTLVAFGVFNYVEYIRMPDQQRARYIPTWERPREVR